jgi:hypothetical protein
MEIVQSPNNRMERGVIDKVLRRGRLAVVLEQAMRARVRDALACARSCERSATRSQEFNPALPYYGVAV